MAGTTLYIEEVLVPDQIACRIANDFREWDMFRSIKIQEWKETQKYIFATDTSKTSNSKLPWSNRTTIPKLCQIRDNLYANYMAALFPKKKWLTWEGDSESDEEIQKKRAIEQYMGWVVDRPEFYAEAAKLVLDYIDYGNCFVVPVWVDQTVSTAESTKVGYVGPMLRRISPFDIVFNPTAPSFVESPKIIRSLVSMGEVKQMIEQETMDDEEREYARALYNYLRETRLHVADMPGSTTTKDELYSIQGFHSFRDYLESNYVEILTFYGDIYDADKDELQRNRIIRVVDRHKILSNRENPSIFGKTPIYHVGWRIRPDNLWAMGPLDNLVGMQYRIDHLENMKADVWDLIAYPPLKVKGYVADFSWGPMERIYTDEDSDVEMMEIAPQVLQANTEIAILEQKMEEMAGAPKEAMGFRTPGEKTKYEVQRQENAAGRIFESKIAQIERDEFEPSYNAMLELARRHMDVTTIRVFDSDLKINLFQTLTPQDISGNGRIRPMAARHFAEKAQQLQDIAGFFQSGAGQDPAILMHFSSIQLAKLHESLLELEDYHIVEPFIRITEEADGQRLANVAQEQAAMDTTTPSGLYQDDFDQGAFQEQGNNAGMAGAPSGPGLPQ